MEEKYQLNRYNIMNHVKEVSKSFVVIPDVVIKDLLELTKNLGQHRSSIISVYTLLFFQQREFNESNLNYTEKCKDFFELNYNTVTKILNQLESWGFIHIETLKNKRKIISFMQYPEYKNREKNPLNDLSIKSKEKIKPTIDNHQDDIPIKDSQNKKDVLIKDDFFLDEYIEYSKKQNRPLKNPAGFKIAYRKNPKKYDLSDFEKYKDNKKKDEQKKIELARIRQKEEDERKIESLKSNDQKFYELQDSVITPFKFRNSEEYRVFFQESKTKQELYERIVNFKHKDKGFPMNPTEYLSWESQN